MHQIFDLLHQAAIHFSWIHISPLTTELNWSQISLEELKEWLQGNYCTFLHNIFTQMTTKRLQRLFLHHGVNVEELLRSPTCPRWPPVSASSGHNAPPLRVISWGADFCPCFPTPPDWARSGQTTANRGITVTLLPWGTWETCLITIAVLSEPIKRKMKGFLFIFSSHLITRALESGLECSIVSDLAPDL